MCGTNKNISFISKTEHSLVTMIIKKRGQEHKQIYAHVHLNDNRVFYFLTFLVIM